MFRWLPHRNFQPAVSKGQRDVTDRDSAHKALSKYFGFNDFLEGQADVVDAVLRGDDVVVVMPTGGGKSLCYQLPALMLEGVTLVVSPLIALMKDQVDQLAARRIPATFINSSLTHGETIERLYSIRRGRFKLVYVAPERFKSDAFTETMAQVNVRLLAADEAHCISHWGHDFRPDYLRLNTAAERLGRPQMIALTATATPHVRTDICEQLGLKDPRIFVAGFDRPNLALQVEHVDGDSHKPSRIERLVRESNGPGIIYAATRKAVEQVSAKLQLARLKVDLYHGGLQESQRNVAQERFMNGDVQVIVATNAFGMGINKSDIRFVVHYHLPGSIEAYYQEVGRAGRDGRPADCLLLFNYIDTRTHQFFIEGKHPPAELIGQVYNYIVSLGQEHIELSSRELANQMDVKNEGSVATALVILERAGHIERGRGKSVPLLCWLKGSIDSALDATPGDTIEAIVLRDLIFNHGLNDRDLTEIDALQKGKELGIGVNLLKRTLGILSNRGLITFRTAYGGRGIRLLDKTPAPLRIDRKELSVRAAAEQWKLRKMIDYCYFVDTGCLRGFILSYFGDSKKVKSCGSCSFCGRERRATASRAGAGTLTISSTSQRMSPATALDRFIIDQAPTGSDLRATLKSQARRARNTAAENQSKEVVASDRPLSPEETIVVRKVLSCVARVEQQFGINKFGKGIIAAVLVGSSSKNVREHSLNSLSTYGLLSEMSQEQVNVFIKALIAANCLEVTKGLYPKISLTELGRDVMRGRVSINLMLPARS